MRYKVELSPAAQRDLKSIPDAPKEAIAKTILGLGENPRPTGVRKISGSQRAWRIRVREYRVIYETYDDRRLVVVLRVDRRRERTYRRL